MTETIIARIIDAPTGFKGCVLLDEDGNVNMYVNGRLSEADKQKTIAHELNHVGMGHLNADCLLTTEEKEKEADEGSYLCEIFNK